MVISSWSNGKLVILSYLLTKTPVLSKCSDAVYVKTVKTSFFFS
jgi:hypothetical protein